MVQNKGLEQKPKAEIAVSSFKKYVIGENEGGKSFNPFQNKFTKKKTLFIKDNFINYDIDKFDNSFKEKSVVENNLIQSPLVSTQGGH